MVEITEETIEKGFDIPMIDDWDPEPDDYFMEFKGDYIQAHYEKLELHPDNKLCVFIIKKSHYKLRADDICKVINYYLKYFDKEWELFDGTMRIKYFIDQRPNMSLKGFQKLIMKEIVTPSFVSKVKEMTNHLYTLNIDSDTEGKYKNTPKITNVQARMIVAISFAIRCILPICIHFSDTNNNFVHKKSYIPCFDKITMKLIREFEKDDVAVFGAIKNFVQYRIERYWKQDQRICFKKKQLYGMTQELYLEEVIHEVILVKSLYKLDYNRSVVSFIDGIIFKYHHNFKIENFKTKPIEIDQQENQGDDSERLSHAEAIEMSVYRIDESNALINEVNANEVLKSIRKRFNVGFEEGELDFYYDNIRISPITKLLVEKFYSRFFHDPNAALNLERPVIIELIVRLKKYLLLRGMSLLPQLCTAKVRGKYRENTIKNSKFNAKVTSSNIWNNIIEKEYTYIEEISPKDNLLLKRFSVLINCQYEFVDFNGPDDGIIFDDLDQDQLIAEFSLFLSIT